MDAATHRIAELLLACFRGRSDYVAKATAKGFEPVALKSPMQPPWMARHLDGTESLGFYLMDAEGCVWCSCVDFDNKADHPDPDWRTKAEKLYLWLQQAGLAPLLEISQSGEAAHVWLFFEEPTPAWIPRAFFRNAGAKLNIPTREIYPRQDQLSGKGMGSLVRYPLWNRSCFVDPEAEWAKVDPIVALEQAKRTTGAELKGLAYNLAMEMKPDDSPVTEYSLSSIAAEAKDELPPRVKARLQKEGTLLYRRWHGDTTGMQDTSRSAQVVSIACELVRQMVPTPEIAAALAYWCHEQRYEKGQSGRAIGRAVSVAYEYVFQRREQASANLMDMRAACHAYLDTLAKGLPTCVPSGVAAIDNSIDGIGWGEMAVIAARPGHGKSALALQWLDHAASEGFGGLILSEEMSHLELGKRGVTFLEHLHESNWCDHLERVRSDVDAHYQQRAAIHLVENCNTIDRAEEVIDSLCPDKGVRVVAVDYLQLLSGRGQKRYEQVTNISGRLKQAARRNNVALIACCQVNREIEERPDHKPRLSDLRDSGSIEQDADLVLFLQWPHKFDETIPETEYHIYAEKRRNGPIRVHNIVTDFFPGRQRIGPFPPRQPSEEG